MFIHNYDTLTVPHWFLPDLGNHPIKYVVSDGIDTADTTRTITMENTPPICNITSPHEGDTLIIGNIDIAVEASDVNGYIESVKFYIDNVLRFTDTEEPYNFIYTDPWLMSGNFEIKAIATDNDNTQTECEISVYFALFIPINPFPDTIFVPQDYAAIQDAIDNSQSGDVIMVADGTYEEYISITHPLGLIGNGDNTHIWSGRVLINCDYVIVKDIRVSGGTSIQYNPLPGIIISNSNYVHIENVITWGANGWMDDNWNSRDGAAGIVLGNSSNITIQNSYLHGGGGGRIYSWGSGGGHGIESDNTADVFIIDSDIRGGDGGSDYPDASLAGHGVKAIDYSIIGIRNCFVRQGEGAEGQRYYIDETSTVIFP